jgi:hypothetical protein
MFSGLPDRVSLACLGALAVVGFGFGFDFSR